MLGTNDECLGGGNNSSVIEFILPNWRKKVSNMEKTGEKFSDEALNIFTEWNPTNVEG